MKKRFIIKSVGFLLILSAFLTAFSILSIRMGRNKDPLNDFSSRNLFLEPDNTIDVLAIGNSNVYSGISPLEWWNSYGFTGYAWGEPSQRIFETYEYLQKIYRRQSPSVVFLETDGFFRDRSDADNLDSFVKAKLANLFPVITYHANLDPHRLSHIKAKGPSVTKGYFIRLTKKKVHPKKKRMKKTKQQASINKLSQFALKKCIALCQKNGSQVVLLSIPSYTSWSMEKYNTMKEISQEYGVPYLDLNIELNGEINWKKDTADAGSHLNYRGAKKVTDYLGNYLETNYPLTNRKNQQKYAQWNNDWKDYEHYIQKHPSFAPTP